MNRYVKIICGRFYSPSLKDVAWLERAQLTFLIFLTFVCKLGRVEAAAREKKLQKNVWKIRKNELSVFYPTYILETWWIQSSTQYFNVAIRKLRKIRFWKNLLVIEFPYKHCNFWPLCLPVKMAPKTVISPILLCCYCPKGLIVRKHSEHLAAVYKC